MLDTGYSKLDSIGISVFTPSQTLPLVADPAAFMAGKGEGGVGVIPNSESGNQYLETTKQQHTAHFQD
jgi:hypothetical protein